MPIPHSRRRDILAVLAQALAYDLAELLGLAVFVGGVLALAYAAAA